MTGSALEMILDLQEEINHARASLRGLSITQLLSGECSPDVLAPLDFLVLKARASRRLLLGATISPKIADTIVPDGWVKAVAYCRSHFEDEFGTPSLLLEALLCVCALEDAGAWLGMGVVDRMEPSLQYDDDCLLIGAPEQISFVKEGVLTNRHWIQYDRSLPGRGLSGGFIEELVKRSERGGPCLRFGLAIDRDVLIKREFFRPVVTRAFIRGPRGCSADLLNNPRFPEDHSGTVTEYRRVDENPVHELYPIERTEVMWSQRGGVKSVQIEELALPSPFRGMVDRVSNRFIHARWDIVSGAFQHLDGATKTYHAAGYKERLSCDIKRWGSRRCVYKKLFRIDAQLDVGEWSNLVAKYFSENELVVEYLESM